MLDETIRTLDKTIRTLDEKIRKLDEVIRTLDETIRILTTIKAALLHTRSGSFRVLGVPDADPEN